MSNLFISYRRDDTAGHVGRLRDRLRQLTLFRNGGLFVDVDSIQAGADFRERVRAAIGLSSLVLVVIGKRWLTAADASGRRRLDDPNDLVREEVATALARKLPVLPVLVGGAAMPSAEELPEPVRPLRALNSIVLSDARFDADVQPLLDRVAEIGAAAESGVRADAEISSETYYAVGTHFLFQKDLANAEASLRAAVQKKPEFAAARVSFATALQFDALERISEFNYGIALGQLREAQDSLSAALPYAGADSALLVQMGYVYKDIAQSYTQIQKGPEAADAMEKARNAFALAVAGDKRNAAAWNGLGSLYLIAQDYDQAIESCKKALKVAPAYSAALHDLAAAYYYKAQASKSASDARPFLQEFTKTYSALLKVQQHPDGEPLPAHSLETLKQIAQWAVQVLMSTAGTPRRRAARKPARPRGRGRAGRKK